MAIRPLHDRVVVTRSEDGQARAGAIIVPDAAAEKSTRGAVIAVGEGRVLDDGRLRPLDAKVGGTALFATLAGTEVKLDGSEHPVMRENDIMAVLGV